MLALLILDDGDILLRHRLRQHTALLARQLAEVFDCHLKCKRTND